MNARNIDERKLRTRTLIQAGGLLSLSKLLEECEITEGEDLQSTPEGYEKSATLFGILIDAAERLLENNDTQKMEKFRNLGATMLKKAAAKY